MKNKKELKKLMLQYAFEQDGGDPSTWTYDTCAYWLVNLDQMTDKEYRKNLVEENIDRLGNESLIDVLVEYDCTLSDLYDLYSQINWKWHWARSSEGRAQRIAIEYSRVV